RVRVQLPESTENPADGWLARAFRRDGKHPPPASRDKTAKVWDIAAKESVLTFPDHQEPVFGVAISLDGKSGISAAQDKNVRWWQATDAGKNIGKQIRAGGGHAKAILRLAYYPDAKKPLLATCSADT